MLSQVEFSQNQGIEGYVGLRGYMMVIYVHVVSGFSKVMCSAKGVTGDIWEL